MTSNDSLPAAITRLFVRGSAMIVARSSSAVSGWTRRRRSRRASITSWMRVARRDAEACSTGRRRISRRSGAISASSVFSSASRTAKLRGLVVTTRAFVRSSACTTTRSSGRIALDWTCWSNSSVMIDARRAAEAFSMG